MELISCAPSQRLFVVRWVAAFGTKKQSQTTNPPAALAHRATGARNSQRSFRCRSMELIGCAAHLRPLVVRLVAAFGAKNEGACDSLAACTVSVAQLQISPRSSDCFSRCAMQAFPTRQLAIYLSFPNCSSRSTCCLWLHTYWLLQELMPRGTKRFPPGLAIVPFFAKLRNLLLVIR